MPRQTRVSIAVKCWQVSRSMGRESSLLWKKARLRSWRMVTGSGSKSRAGGIEGRIQLKRLTRRSLRQRILWLSISFRHRWRLEWGGDEDAARIAHTQCRSLGFCCTLQTRSMRHSPRGSLGFQTIPCHANCTWYGKPQSANPFNQKIVIGFNFLA
ncbi:MAG: hypothetical protein Ct9H300mP8_10590 [Gammaproteobacteria bacterium]|nr:MAG: hypothetical protein Ct9H300mP8_10590 [Gammaproteobacteria bacterium]